MICELCGKSTASYKPLLNNNSDVLLVCPSCEGRYDAYADAEYDRQREEGV